MSAHRTEKASLRHVILDDDRDKHRNLKNTIAPVQPGGRFAQRFASVMVEFLVLVMVCVGVVVAFAGLLVGHRENLKRLPDAHQLVARRQESHLGTGGLDLPSWRSNRLCG